MSFPNHFLRIASITTAFGALFPLEGKADSIHTGIAVNVVFPFGKLTKPGVGIEVFSNYNICTDIIPVSFGPSLQWSTGFGQGQRVSLSGRADANLLVIEPGLEIGISKSAQGLSMHRGVKASSLFSNAFVRGDAGGYYMGIGPQIHYDMDDEILVPMNSIGCYVIDGRPFRDQEGEKCSGNYHWQETEHVHSIDCDEANLLAQTWAESAQHELDSVPAFLQLAWELIANHAPDELISAALDAAEDEIKHAQQCIQMANTYHQKQLKLVPPSFSGRPILTGKAGLMRLAAESWVDGCLGEGFAAQKAMLGAQSTQQIFVHTTKKTIANDEQKHAQLAWKILSWVLSQDTDGDIRAYLAEIRNPSPDFSTTHQSINIKKHGCIPNQEQEAIWKAVQTQAVSDLNFLLHKQS